MAMEGNMCIKQVQTLHTKTMSHKQYRHCTQKQRLSNRNDKTLPTPGYRHPAGWQLVAEDGADTDRVS